jgi:hypothetical protein
MARAVRRQICLDKELDIALAEIARRLGVSQGEVVRAALRRYVEEPRGTAAEAAWHRVLDSMGDAFAAGPIGPVEETSGRGWTRSDLYDIGAGGPSCAS